MKLKIKNIVYLLCGLLISTATFPIFDLSPWIVIDNTTKLDFTCELEALYYPNEDENITIFINKNDNFDISFDQWEDENKNECIKIIIKFICSANHATVLDPMFYEDDSLFNPQIKLMKLTHASLQLTTFCYAANPDHRYFSVDYRQDKGITVNNHAISMTVKCLNNFKQSMRSIILAALDATNWLPY